MIRPERALVRPCVRPCGGGAPVPLEQAVRAIIVSGAPGRVTVIGGPGAGKTTALRHLAATIPSDGNVELMDNAVRQGLTRLGRRSLVIYAHADGSAPPEGVDLARFELAPWGPDEWIEYLLNRHPARVASVMGRLQVCSDIAGLKGVPLLVRIVLDAFAEDDSLTSAIAALSHFMDAALASDAIRRDARTYCLNHMFAGDPGTVGMRLAGRVENTHAVQCLRHWPVRLMLAVERILLDLEANGQLKYLVQRLDPRWIDAVGKAVADDKRAIQHLADMVASDRLPRRHATAAGILVAANIGWRPDDDTRPDLTAARLRGAAWSGLRLPGAELACADLSRADLTESCFDKAQAADARLVGADLRDASIQGIHAPAADLTRAVLAYVRADRACLPRANLSNADCEGARLTDCDLYGADLTAARFMRCNLQSADLRHATVADTDFTGASFTLAQMANLDLRSAALHGASFARANLQGCNLEEQHLPGADFEAADLEGALFTGSVMPGAVFAYANLSGAGLAHVEWERADLRDADLRNASFHLGSSRSGLVGSPIACEGSRTGFYTDDYDEQNYRAPEDIRKANLRGADLRGAIIDGTDFYLVDLRDARYDPDQEEHFRRCRAILEARV